MKCSASFYNAPPKKIVFLSVEGDETERTYFQHLGEKLDNTLIQIEVLRHKHGDGYSDPQYVIELGQTVLLYSGRGDVR